MECDDLVAEDVVAGRDGLGDGHGPGVVVGDQLVSAPGSGVGSIADQTDLVDLEELQCRLVNAGAVSGALGEVVDDWAVMAARPRGPLKLHDVASCDLG